MIAANEETTGVREPSAVCEPSTRRGAYGLELLGVDHRLLLTAPPHWPSLELVRRLGRSRVAASYQTEGSACIVFQGDGFVHVDRGARQAVYTTSRTVSDEALVHPYLAPVAAVAAAWLDRQSFHGGGFVAAGGVWGLLGPRGAGKSSTLALLAREGYEIFCDDLIVTDLRTAMAGPRSIDLRTETASELELGENLGFLGARERWRLALGPVAPELPLLGWIHLEWSKRIKSTRMPATERITALASHAATNVMGAGESMALLDLAALPTWTLARPASWRSAPEAIHRLLALVHDDA